MVTKKGGIPGVEFALAKTATGENNYLEWHLTVTGPVSALECSIGVLHCCTAAPRHARMYASVWLGGAD